jgi:hypothetical protein
LLFGIGNILQATSVPEGGAPVMPLLTGFSGRFPFPVVCGILKNSEYSLSGIPKKSESPV